MAMTITLVAQGHNFLRYQVVYDGTSGTGVTAAWTTTGAATPDLRTDSLAGPIKKLARTSTDGYGSFASGAQTQAKARALWLSILTSVNPGSPTLGLVGLPTAEFRVMCQTSTSGAATPAVGLVVDADVSAGEPVVRAALQGDNAQSGTWLVDVFVPGAIGA